MIEIKDVKKNFGSKRVLNGVSFSVEDGIVYGLIGKNGAGKTTLMSIIAGLLPSNGGSYISSGPKIGYLPDVPAFFDYMTCGEYMDFLLKNSATKRRDELLGLVMIDKNVKIGSMSRGMRQRLGIAAVLSGDPHVILFDEPTSALDPEGRADFRRILNELKKSGKSIILSTHILTDMEVTCEKVGFLHEGIIKRELYVPNLKDTYSLKVVFESAYSLAPPNNHFSAEPTANNTVIFTLNKNTLKESQKRLFSHFAEIDNTIISIENDSKNLDTIFKEVCGE